MCKLLFTSAYSSLCTIRVTVVTLPHINEVEVTSSADCIQPPPEEDRSIPDILRSQDNPDLWKHLVCEEDGWWIRDALINGTLYLVSDGSYQKDVDPDVCSCAFCLVCTESLRRISCTWAERSKCTSNYRGELLGALGYLLILKAVIPNDRNVLVDISNLPASEAFCDNMGVVKHGRLPLKALSEKQVHSDILGHIKYLLRSLPARTRFTHVRAHMRKVLAEEDMTLEQILNDEMDEQAVDALVTAVRDDDFITTQFPHERITMQCGEERVTASPTEAIYDWNGQRTAMELFEEKDIISKELFHHIYWEGLGKVMKTQFNSSFSTFYSKHMIRCCGVCHHLHEIDPSIPNVCPCCESPDETTGHIILCPNKDRTTLYNKSVQELVKWMYSVQTSPILIRMIGKYLDARNTMSIVDTLNYVEQETTELELELAKDHDSIGW